MGAANLRRRRRRARTGTESRADRSRERSRVVARSYRTQLTRFRRTRSRADPGAARCRSLADHRSALDNTRRPLDRSAPTAHHVTTDYCQECNPDSNLLSPDTVYMNML